MLRKELTGMDRDCQGKEKEMKHESDETFHPSNAFVFYILSILSFPVNSAFDY
jgi:hypothetical protein